MESRAEQSSANEPHVVIHTDGACSGNPGPGGWGAVLAFGDREKELKGGEAHTTNNRMELMAAIAALEALKRPCLVDVHTDSQYLRNGVMSWLNQWKRNGWRTADKKPVKNIDLWQRLDARPFRPRPQRAGRPAGARGAARGALRPWDPATIRGRLERLVGWVERSETHHQGRIHFARAFTISGVGWAKSPVVCSPRGHGACAILPTRKYRAARLCPPYATYNGRIRAA